MQVVDMFHTFSSEAVLFPNGSAVVMPTAQQAVALEGFTFCCSPCALASCCFTEQFFQVFCSASGTQVCLVEL